jgi:endonuclease/exonuclease/phosphatase family metal-dependent hydrolase
MTRVRFIALVRQGEVRLRCHERVGRANWQGGLTPLDWPHPPGDHDRTAMPHALARRVAAFALLAAAAAAQQGAPTLRLGTWNLENFGTRKDPARTPDDVQKVADFIRDLRPAVLAVQEVGGEQPLRDLCRRIGPAFAFVLGTTGGFDDGSNRISVGFVYDCEQVELLHAEELLSFPRELEGQPIFHRVPVTACFRDKRGTVDFRAVSVHFKAGRKPEDEHKRRLEAQTLRAWIAGTLGTDGEDQDLVVLGDFNHTFDTEPQQVLEQNGIVRYLRPRTLTPTIVHFDAPIDQVAASRGFDELLGATLDVHNEQGLADKTAWQRVYSDHFPVTVEIACAADADPTAIFGRGPAGQRLPRDSKQVAEAPPAAARAAAATGRTDARSPIAIGSSVVVFLTGGQGSVTGLLKETLPPGPAGWVVLEENGKTIAIPWPQVVHVRER